MDEKNILTKPEICRVCGNREHIKGAKFCMICGITLEKPADICSIGIDKEVSEREQKEIL